MQNLKGPFILERQGCPLHYWVAGKNKAPWVVFCHGARMNHTIFAEQPGYLLDRYRVLLIDMRGHGDSRPMGDDFSIELAAEDVVAIFDQCHIDKAVVVGHSMSGLIAQTIAKVHAERVRGLVLVGTFRLTASLPPFSGVMRRALKTVVDMTPDSWVHFSTRGAGTQERTKQSAILASRMVPKEDFKKIVCGILNGIKPEPGYQLPVPILLMQADKDLVGMGLLRVFSRSWIKQEAQGRYVLISNARHNMMQDNPKEFNRHLLEFLQSLE